MPPYYGITLHQVLDRVRKVAAAKGAFLACALDTKGPEIRTAMLRGGKDIQLLEGEGMLHIHTACYPGCYQCILTACKQRWSAFC